MIDNRINTRHIALKSDLSLILTIIWEIETPSINPNNKIINDMIIVFIFISSFYLKTIIPISIRIKNKPKFDNKILNRVSPNIINIATKIAFFIMYHPPFKYWLVI